MTTPAWVETGEWLRRKADADGVKLHDLVEWKIWQLNHGTDALDLIAELSGRLRRIQKLHRRGRNSHWCRECSQRWPCETATVASLDPLPIPTLPLEQETPL